VYHYTSYALAAGVPLAVYMGEPLSTLVDLGMTVILPLHLHIGMRSILVDYVHTPENQKAALVVLAFFTVVTTLALVKLNFFDVGLTQALKEIFTQQTSTGEKETEKDVFAHLSPKK
jgi:succinate dehydrogenase hydrophobic anchor subunit